MNLRQLIKRFTELAEIHGDDLEVYFEDNEYGDIGVDETKVIDIRTHFKWHMKQTPRRHVREKAWIKKNYMADYKRYKGNKHVVVI